MLPPVQHPRRERQRRRTERTAYILRVRQLAVGIAKAYVEGLAPRTTRAPGPRFRAPGRRLPAPVRQGAGSPEARSRSRRINESRTPDRTRRRRAARELVAAAHAAAGGGHRAATRRSAAGHGRAARGVQHAAASRGPRGGHRRATARFRRAPHRPAGVGGDGAGRAADASRVRLCEEARRGGRRSRARADTEGDLSRVPQSAARQVCRRCAAGRADRRAARPQLSETDALGRAARRWQGRADIWPADPLAAVPLRRPGGAVCHPPIGRRPEPARAGSSQWPCHPRTPVSGDQRAIRACDQGEDLRRVPRPAGRELRRARSRGAPRADCPRPRNPGRTPRRARASRVGRGVRPARRGA